MLRRCDVGNCKTTEHAAAVDYNINVYKTISKIKTMKEKKVDEIIQTALF